MALPAAANIWIRRATGSASLSGAMVVTISPARPRYAPSAMTDHGGSIRPARLGVNSSAPIRIERTRAVPSGSRNIAQPQQHVIEIDPGLGRQRNAHPPTLGQKPAAGA